jgi:parallel beta-helix repeat protein
LKSAVNGGASLPVRHLIALLSMIIAVGIFPGQGAAKIFHVDAGRGDDSSAGTESEPFRTIARATKVVEPGDTVLIHKGVYHEQISGGKSGSESNPITYEGTDRSEVVLQGSVLVKDWQRQGNSWVRRGLKPITDGNAFVMVDEKRMLRRVPSVPSMPEGSIHLSPDGTYSIRLWKNADPNRDHSVEVYELDFAFNSGDRWGGTAKKWIVLRNLTLEKYGSFGISTDAKHPADNSHWELDSLTVRYNRAEGVFHCLDDWYVHDCIFMRNGVHGCQLNGARIRFFQNISMENEWFGPSGNGGCGILIGPDESAHSCEVRNNIFRKNGTPDGYGCGVYLEGRSHNNVIENNLVLGGTSSGIGFFGSSYNKVVNNVLVNIAPGTDWDQAAAFVVNHSYEGAPTQSVGNLVAHNTIWGCPSPVGILKPNITIKREELNRFVNNLFARCRYLSPVPSSPVIILEGNGFFSCPTHETGKRGAIQRWLKAVVGKEEAEGARNVTGYDAGFRDPTVGDFHLRRDSPAIGAGIPTSEVPVDRDGHPREPGKRPSIGAYEYSSSAESDPPGLQ